MRMANVSSRATDLVPICVASAFALFLLSGCSTPTIRLIVANNWTAPIIVEGSHSMSAWRLEPNEEGPDVTISSEQTLLVYDTNCQLLASDDMSVYVFDPVFYVDGDGKFGYHVTYLGGDPGPPGGHEVSRCSPVTLLSP